MSKCSFTDQSWSDDRIGCPAACRLCAGGGGARAQLANQSISWKGQQAIVFVFKNFFLGKEYLFLNPASTEYLLDGKKR